MKLEIKTEDDKLTIQNMAELLHESCCTQDHADSCGWYYEGEDWKQKAHVMWYQKAKQFMQVLKLKYEAGKKEA